MADKIRDLEPNQMKRDKYNVIFMRDRTSIKSFRLNPFWIKFIIFFFLILLLVSVAGSYYSLVFFQEKKELSSLYERKAQALYDTQKELERLDNINKMIKSSKEDELRSFTRAQPGPIATHKPEEAEVVPEIDLREIFEPVDLDIVSIANVQARIIQNRMRVQLEVNSLESGGPISGRVFLILVAYDGSVADLQLQDRDLYYRINNFKQMDTIFELPEGLDQETLFALRIDVRDDGDNLIYSRSFAINDILV